MLQNLVYLLDRVIRSKSQKLRKENEYIWFCPFCNHYKPKLQINLISEKWHCWVCNAKGRSLFYLFQKLNSSKSEIDELNNIVGRDFYKSYSDKSSITKKVELPKEFKPFWNGGYGIIKHHALNYLYKRNITDEDIIKYNIGYCDYGLYSNRIIIPSYDLEGQLNFFVGRDFYNSKMKYKNCTSPKNVVGFDLFINWDEPIVLVEGPFDAIAAKRNAIPLFGKTILSNLKKKIYEKKVTDIYIALDEDALTDSIKIMEEFMKNGINTYLIKSTQKDPSDIGFYKFIELTRKAKQFKFSDLIKLKLNGNTKRYMEAL